jgi:hypothetical protein
MGRVCSTCGRNEKSIKKKFLKILKDRDHLRDTGVDGGNIKAEYSNVPSDS